MRRFSGDLEPSFAALDIAADIRQAYTPPGWLYTEPAAHERVRERVLARSWHFLSDTDRLRTPGQVLPRVLLEGCLDTPLLLTRDSRDVLHCLSNVCTHRGALVCQGEGVEPVLRCRYHGRRFALDGRFLSMPEFEGVEGFPSAADDLPAVPFGTWRKFLFAAVDPAFPLAELVAEMEERVGWLPIEEATFDPARSRDYLVRANWALYCDNYLEGFHIPYVHPALNQAVDYDTYRTERFRYASVQVGHARGAEDSLTPPPSSPDHGRRVAAYYFWLHPATMFNFYPWGISVNAVRPLAVDRTRVSFLTYVWDPDRLEQTGGWAIDRVEREDEGVVESVHAGLRSGRYERGRYSPARETGVHHFHRLLVAQLQGA